MDKEKLKELCEMSTPGPWMVEPEEDSDYLIVVGPPGPNGWCQPVVSLHDEANAAFIAAAREAVPALLAEIEILRTKNKAFAGANDHLKEELDALQKENADLAAWAEKTIDILDGYRGQVDRFGNSPAMDFLSLPISGSAQRRNMIEGSE